MTRAELEQVRDVVKSAEDFDCQCDGGDDVCHDCGAVLSALDILNAELARPEALEWRMCYVFGQKFNRDGFGEDGPWDSEVQARAILAACSAMPDYFVEPELHSRIKAGPAGPWERAE